MPKKGHPHTLESRQKMSLVRLGNKNCVGRILSIETKKKISTSLTGRIRSPEAIRKQRLKMLGRKHKPESIIKMKLAQKGIPKSEEHKRKYKEARKNWVTPFKDTKPERVFQKALSYESINFKKHKAFRIGDSFHQVDIFVEPNICIEVDGNKWHNYPIGTDRDREIDKELLKQHKKILRFWESDIKRDVQVCIDKVKDVMLFVS